MGGISSADAEGSVSFLADDDDVVDTLSVEDVSKIRFLSTDGADSFEKNELKVDVVEVTVASRCWKG